LLKAQQLTHPTVPPDFTTFQMFDVSLMSKYIEESVFKSDAPFLHTIWQFDYDFDYEQSGPKLRSNQASDFLGP
jgi:hypothetical protein